jgi:hypothetical protein
MVSGSYFKILNVLQMSIFLGSFYVSNGTSPLIPWELLKLREYHISSNDLWNLEFYTMALISIRLALREGETENIKVEDFSRDLSVVHDSGDVKSLAVIIKV